MLENLTSKFSRVLSAFGLKKRLTEGNIEESLAEIRAALIEADVALPVIKNFIQRVKERFLGKEVLASVNPGDFFVKILHDELVSFLGGEAIYSLQLGEANQTNAILLCGLQGAGKTTTCGKLALKLKSNRDIVLVSLDVNRPAAAEQLRILAGQAGVDYYDRGSETDVKKIVKGAFDHAKKSVRNLVIFDTAGRTQIDEAMLAELKSVHSLVRPVETLLVVDAMIGQQALAVASEFKKTVPVSSLIFTKFDSDTRGGAVLSVKETLGVPIAFVGVGEAIQGLESFDASRIAGRILGMGDVVGLVEKAQENFDAQKAQKLAEKIQKDQFDLGDFLEQLNQLTKMGSMESILEMIPGLGAQAKNIPIDEKRFVRMRAAIQSMTPAERQKPFLLNQGSRKTRITRGSGTDMLVIQQTLKQFNEMKGMMKKMKTPGKMKAFLGQMGLGEPDLSKFGPLPNSK